MKHILAFLLLALPAFAQPAIQVQTGRGMSNAFVGGTLYAKIWAFTNLNASGTPSQLASCVIPAAAFDSDGTAVARWGGKFAHTVANTNQFQIVYGSAVLLDTGLLPSSNGAWHAVARITRTADLGQHVEAYFDWGGCAGVPFQRTNVNLEITQTNSIDTVLALRGGARRVGAHTNNSFSILYEAPVR